ncbi:MAG: DUF1302 family protein [Giesbergeria sp.]|uniref:DUF1302 domain-containing protein n=1 Tax=Giesbergeria sp. TaxID=2818473 RepID=UPI0026040A76|nr:DUF1302 family protein [Giesbergeria sp.]MDD2610223.1 DUF1302 family protein [Giesbergeria sp.]
MNPQQTGDSGAWPVPRAVALAAALMMMGGQAQAQEELDSTSDFKINWTNTVKYSGAARTAGHDAALVGNPATASNVDDGDRNFGKGLISNRLELSSELDVVSSRGFGARLSATGWYDTVYNRSNDNPGFAGGAFPNSTSVAPDAFTSQTRKLHGRKVEVRDAFVFGKTDIGGMPVTARLGQHALVWGESLFFASNAIAGGQSSFDISRLLADPTAQAKEFVLPVPQLSAQLQVSSTLTLGAYYQFRHKPNRLPAVGSYFSVSDVVGEGAERLLLPSPLAPALRTADQKARNSGQFGLQAKWRLGETDLGLYAIRFHDKDPQQVSRLGGIAPQLYPASYYLAHHEGTTAYGASASHSFGDVNVALEGSIRHQQSLASAGHAADVSGVFGGPANDNQSNPAYAVGNTAHINASAIWALQPSALWREASFVGEMAWNRLLSCRQSCNNLDPNATRDAVSFRAVFEPMYRQVMPGLDLSVPMGVGYTPKGSRSVLGPSAVPPEGGGDFTLGLSGLYQQAWRFSVAYTHFFGSAGTLLDASQSFSYQQSRKDRNFLSFSVRRSF